MRKWLAIVSVLLTGVSCIHDPELKDEQNEIEVYCDALLEMALDEPADAFRYAFLLDAALSLPEGKQEEALDRIPARLLPDGCTGPYPGPPVRRIAGYSRSIVDIVAER